MQVILLERVAKLGQMGEVVNVKDGYARNFLLPQKQGAARVRGQHQGLRIAEGPARGPQPRDQEGSRGAGRPARRPAVRRDPLGLGRRRALRLGHAPRRGRRGDRGGLHARPPADRACRADQGTGLHELDRGRCTPRSRPTIVLNVARSRRGRASGQQARRSRNSPPRKKPPPSSRSRSSSTTSALVRRGRRRPADRQVRRAGGGRGRLSFPAATTCAARGPGPRAAFPFRRTGS
jgi:hypothetical protein